jgi:hypothetical protein
LGGVLMTYTYKTTLAFRAADDEHEFLCRIKFVVYPGSPQTRDDPGSDPAANIHEASVQHGSHWLDLPWWLFDSLIDDEGLKAELLQHAAEDDEYHRDQKADADREERAIR